ncbi:hypothetical protein ACF07V_34825 [Streptomyces sp. NPDC015661]|uniref:hypothetical protein n=1 Tax=Streptomyces sp. NPDC015661 TaxID=3364961 RepID=UPI0036FE87C1
MLTLAPTPGAEAHHGPGQAAAPRLSISKVADAASVNAGSPIGYTIVVTGQGPGTVVGAALTDPLPSGAGVQWQIAPSYRGPGSCTLQGPAGSQTLRCAFGSLRQGTQAVVHVAGTTTTASCGTYPNTATAAARNAPPVRASASATVACPPPPPSLSVAKTADAATVDAGDPIGFTITTRNGGGSDATGVTVSDPLPLRPGVSWTMDPVNPACSITGTVDSQTLSCSYPNLPAGASDSVHVESLTIFEGCGTYDNTATVASGNGGGARATASTTVLCPSMSLGKTADAQTVTAGDQIGFTVTVGNGGPGTAKGVTLSDPLPAAAGVDWALSTAVTGCAIRGVAGSQALECELGDIPSGGSVSVHVVSATNEGSCGTHENAATARATNQSGAFRASAATTVLCSARAARMDR